MILSDKTISKMIEEKTLLMGSKTDIINKRTAGKERGHALRREI